MLKVTKETLPTLTARDLQRLNSSGKLQGKVQLWLPREGGNRMRRPNEAVAAEMLSVWPEGQEVILIPGEGPARDAESDRVCLTLTYLPLGLSSICQVQL